VEGPEEKPPTVWRQLATPFGDRIVNRNQSIYVATRCQAVEGPEEDPNRLATVGYALEPSHRESQPPLYVATRCQAVEDPEGKPPTVWRQLATPLGHRMVNRNQSFYVATCC
jgi:hypothetical protein